MPTPAELHQDGLALTPADGMEQLELFWREHQPARRFSRAAERMVASGLKAAGYEYLVIDDIWHGWPQREDGSSRKTARNSPTA